MAEENTQNIGQDLPDTTEKAVYSDSNFIPKDIFEEMFRNRKVRTAITREDMIYFFNFYLAEYITYPTAPFQKRLFKILEDEKVKNFFLTSFRGSGKSTIVTTCYPLWAILGKQQKKFVLILCQTKTQAKQHMMNLRRELEHNRLLKNDMGPFQEDHDDEWGSASLVFTNLNARITVASTEQSIRGLRHGPYRPDLIICDDVEDIASTKTRESRDRTYQWLTGEVIPAGDINTKLVIIGNLLHEDCLLKRLDQDIYEGRLTGVSKMRSVLEDDGTSAWPGKYPDAAAIEAERKKIGNNIAFQREYMLKIIPENDRVIFPEWIQYYDALADTSSGKCTYIGTYSGVDLAISQAASADCTAVVSVRVYRYTGGERKYYILPHPINERLVYPRIREKLKEVSTRVGNGSRTTLYIEKVAFQAAVADDLRESGFNAIGVPVAGDKRERLCLISPMIEQGIILFPRKGCELLINQLVYFGVEKHDDLSDALVLAITELTKNKPSDPDALSRLNPHLMNDDPGEEYYTSRITGERVHRIRLDTRF